MAKDGRFGRWAWSSGLEHGAFWGQAKPADADGQDICLRLLRASNAKLPDRPVLHHHLMEACNEPAVALPVSVTGLLYVQQPEPGQDLAASTGSLMLCAASVCLQANLLPQLPRRARRRQTRAAQHPPPVADCRTAACAGTCASCQASSTPAS